MNRHDREEIVTFVMRMMTHARPNARVDRNVVIRKFVDACGTPGSGACICQWPPDKARAHCAHHKETFEAYEGKLILDHRCDQHGEKAQPKLWGRNKTLELHVTSKQWLALGVEYNDATDEDPSAPEPPEEDADGYRAGDISPDAMSAPDYNYILLQYKKHEQANEHCEGGLLLAGTFGTESEIARAQEFLAERDRRGHASAESVRFLYEMSQKYYGTLVSKTENVA